jgi:lipoprotein NlpI
LAKAVSGRAEIRADQLQRAAEIVYQAGDSKTSVELFDRVIEMAPGTMPFNWQRGIALCCVGDFKRGAEQFEAHHQVNPDDVENSAWYFLCVAKTKGIEAARETIIPSRGDPRQPMMSILQMYRGELKPKRVMEAASESSPEGVLRARAKFYADLYIGLYYDSLGQSEQAGFHLKRSLEYGQSGYMYHAARIYLSDRLSEAEAE